MRNTSKSDVYKEIERQIAQYFEDKQDVVAVYLFGWACGVEEAVHEEIVIKVFVYCYPDVLSLKF
jgi:hypothetical protein